MASSQRPASPGNEPYPYPESGLELYQPEQHPQYPPAEQQHQYYGYGNPNVVKPPESMTSPTISQQPYGPPSQADPGYHHEKDGTPLEERKIMGIRRSKFWVGLAAIVALAIIAALAGALGASLNGNLKTSKNSDTPTPASSGTPGSSQTSSSSGPSSTPTITTVAGPGQVAVQCPSADGITYTGAGNKTFKRICNYDFPFNDLYNITAMTMEECMDSCAASSRCIAVTWDYAGPQGTDNNFCFAKSYIGVKSAGQNLESAVLLQ